MNAGRLVGVLYFVGILGSCHKEGMQRAWQGSMVMWHIWFLVPGMNAGELRGGVWYKSTLGSWHKEGMPLGRQFGYSYVARLGQAVEINPATVGGE
jgi:hypothetical protein